MSLKQSVCTLSSTSPVCELQATSLSAAGTSHWPSSVSPEHTRFPSAYLCSPSLYLQNATSLTLCHPGAEGHKSAVPQARCVQCHLPRGHVIPACKTVIWSMQVSSMSRQQRHSIKAVELMLHRSVSTSRQTPAQHHAVVK